MDYGTIKEVAKDMGVSVQDLIALAPQNDPFYTGTPGELKKARWFSSIWNRFGYSHGVHLRRVHYQLVSQDPPIAKPNGDPYQNTRKDWDWLTLAAKYARYLGLVKPESFVDRRNPDAITYADYQVDPSPSVDLLDPERGLDVEFPDLPYLFANGYDFGNLQPYHLEVWVEKTTMNDVLRPVCRRYGANLVTGAGELSITAAIDLIDRVKEANRPCRIFYIADFDPAGYGMPVSVARKLEFFVRERGLDLDIRVQHIALTRNQVHKYDLPRQPIKASELRKSSFEESHGKGAVELDAIEALHPGELGRIVEDAILIYYDREIEERAKLQRNALQRKLDKASEEALGDIEDDIGALKEDFEEAMGSIRERLSNLYPKIIERLEDVEAGVDDFPLPRPGEADEPYGVLFDSFRGYFEQLDHYQDHQDGH
jgi:hypothetical protein